MTTNIEEQLVAAMRQEVAGIALTADVVGEAARRHQRRTVVQRSLYAAGVIGLAGVLTAVVAVGSGGQPGSGTNPPPVVAAESPSLRLAAAVSASENTSYKVKITAAVRGDSYSGKEVTEGAFDPTTATGYLHTPYGDGTDRFYEQRLIKGVRFLGSSDAKSFKQEAGKYDRLAYFDALHGASSASADPDQLFKMLKQADAKITQTSASRYHFEIKLPSDLKVLQKKDSAISSASSVLVGDVTLDAKKRVSRVTVEQTSRMERAGQVSTNSIMSTVELSGYGTAVSVQRPTEVIVAR
jgi:hypothetical protein